MCIQLIEEDLTFGIGQSSVNRVTASDRNHFRLLLWDILPLDGRPLLRQIQGIHDVGKGGVDIHCASHHQGSTLMAPQDTCGKCPGNLEVLDVFGVNLIQ